MTIPMKNNNLLNVISIKKIIKVFFHIYESPMKCKEIATLPANANYCPSLHNSFVLYLKTVIPMVTTQVFIQHIWFDLDNALKCIIL